MKNELVYQAYQYASAHLAPIKEMPTKSAFLVAKFIIALEDWVNAIDLVRNKIIEEHMEREENGEPKPVLDSEGNRVPGKFLLTTEGTKKLQDLMSLNDESREVPKIALSLLEDVNIPDPVVAFLVLQDFIDSDI
jgi:hypothetical protein